MHNIPIRIFSFVLLSALFYSWSYYLLKHYTLGDQVFYTALYEAINGASPGEVMLLGRLYVGSAEPISILILWLGANLGFEKNFYISLLNLALGLGVFLLLSRYKAPWYFFLLVFSNFYLIVLMTGAERLKIAYLFLVFSALVPQQLGFGMAALSPLAHLQSFIFLTSLAATKAVEPLKVLFKKLKISKRALIFGAISGAVMVILFLALEDAVVSKGTGYAERSEGFSELSQIVLLGIIGTVVTRDRLRMIAALTPLAVAIYLLGGLRVNMIAATVVLYLLLIEGRTKHPLLLLLMVYLSAKSIPFVNNILTNGNGFDGYLF